MSTSTSIQPELICWFISISRSIYGFTSTQLVPTVLGGQCHLWIHPQLHLHLTWANYLGGSTAGKHGVNSMLFVYTILSAHMIGWAHWHQMTATTTKTPTTPKCDHISLEDQVLSWPIKTMQIFFTILLPYMCHQQIWPLNARCIPHIQISSCADMRQVYPHICFTWTHCNQPKNKKMKICYCHINGSNRYALQMPYTCHICKLLNIHQWEKYFNIYAT